MALDDDLRTIQTRISQLNSKKARAEVELDNATAKKNAARAALKEEFGVSTTADAKQKQAELEEALTTVVSEIEAELEEAGA